MIGPESFYYRMKLQLNSGDQDAISKSKQADEFAWYLKNMVLFFPLSLTQIPETKQSEFLADPLLEPYHHFLEKKFRSSKHQLSPECEKIINLFEETSYKKWDSMTSKFLSTSQKEILLPMGKKQVTLEELFSYTCNDDVSIRQQAIHAVDEIHLEAKEMAENETNAILSYKKTLDTLRGFSSAEDFIALRDDIDLKTIHTMIDAVRESYSFSRDFYQFKADLF